jgi:rhodanese-related sulfurtransferase
MPGRRSSGPATLISVSAAVDSSQIEIDPEQLADWQARDPDLQVIDVRELYEREAGHIAGSRHISLAELTGQARSVERERPVVFYCRVGVRSEMAAQAFRIAGVQAHSMRGGLVRWAQEGRPLTPEDGHVADHKSTS